MPPPPEGAHSVRETPRRRSKLSLPAVDERLVMPETRFEIIDGKVEHVPPADEAHGTRHSKIAALLEAHAAEGYDVAVDMLTRTSVKGDMAPDASVFPAARDPQTGGRQLEELAFEVVSTERLGHAATKARALSKRGVRRIFAVDVERRRALTWSPPTDTWEILANDAVIEDRALAAPLPLRALVETAKADDAIAAALLAKKNEVILSALRDSEARGEKRGEARGEERGRARGVVAGKRASLLAVLSARGLPVTKKAEKKIRDTDDEAKLDLWLRRALTATSTEEVLKK